MTLRRFVLTISLVALAACGSEDEASLSCHDDSPVVAMNRNQPDFEGGAQVITISGRDEVRVISGDWVATEPSFDPSGRLLVVSRADGDYESAGPGSASLWILDIAEGSSRKLTHGRYDRDPDWSPDGGTIAYSHLTGRGSGQLTVVDADGSEPRTLLPDRFDAYAPAWSPDSDRIAFVRAERQSDLSSRTSVWLVDSDGTDVELLADIDRARSVEWSPDGESLLVTTLGAERGGMTIVDVDDGKADVVADGAALGAWSADGDRIYYDANESVVSGPDTWRPAVGRLEDGRLHRDRFLGDATDYYLYPYFGLTVGPCG